MEERITSLETKVSHLEHVLDELNSVVTDLAEAAKRRDTKVELLAERYRQLVEGDEELVDRRPPHY